MLSLCSSIATFEIHCLVRVALVCHQACTGRTPLNVKFLSICLIWTVAKKSDCSAGNQILTRIESVQLNLLSNYSFLDIILFIWLPDRFITFSTMGTGKHKMQVTAVIKFWSLYGSNLTYSSTADTDSMQTKYIIASSIG